jgi:hypothetical protein
VLILVSYLKWRDGLKSLARTAWEYGAQHLNDVGSAQRDRRVAFGVWVTQFIFGIIAALVIFEITFQAVLSGTQGGVRLSSSQTSDLQAQLFDIFLATAIVGEVVALLLNFFASRSLARAIDGISQPVDRGLLRQGAALMVIGAALNVLGLLVLFTPGGLVVAAVSPFVIALGVTQLMRGYDAWLDHPPPLTPMAVGEWRGG